MLQTKEEVLKNLKIKPLTKEQIVISMDRLTRFKPPEVKYLRVFSDILTNNLISPKFKKSELERMDYAEIRALSEFVFNYSLKSMGFGMDDDYLINQRLYDYENSIFLLDDNINDLLKNKINYKTALALIDTEEIPLNLKWLKSLACAVDIKQTREQFSLLYPLEKIIICEGITEETLLPVFADILGYNFNRNGVYVLSIISALLFAVRGKIFALQKFFAVLRADGIFSAGVVFFDGARQIFDLFRLLIDGHAVMRARGVQAQTVRDR